MPSKKQFSFLQWLVYLMNLFLKEPAKGLFAHDRAIFGFRLDAEKDTGSLLKISHTTMTLKWVNLTNFLSITYRRKRNVRFICYELNIKGKKLESTSKQMMLNKSSDLLLDNRQLNPSENQQKQLNKFKNRLE